jgi:putative FmdB family regulatory protein
MPTYDYSCDACHHEFEVFESISAEPQKKCPKCKKLKLRRLFGAGAGLIFKGSGFYQTDYRSESYKKAAEAEKPKSDTASDSGAKSDSSSKTESASKTETKSESKSDPKPSPGAKSDSKKKKA